MKRQAIDYGLLAAVILLLGIGIAMVYSASNVVANYKFNDSFYYLKRQLLFSGIGLVVVWVVVRIDLSKIIKWSFPFFLITLVLLGLVLIPGVGVVRGGARSWIGVGSFSIQPAEFMKIACLFLFTKYISQNYSDLKKFKNFLGCLVIVGVVFGLIMLQPDFGTGLVILLSSICLLFISGAPLKYFLLLGGVGGLGLAGLIISAPYRLERIFAFLDPWSDPLGSGFQGIQALFAIAPSGIFGLGYNQSMQKHFFLPEPQNDFIFAIILEELGLIGGVIIIGLYLYILIKAIRISARVTDPSLSFLSLGIGISLFIQVIINLFVVIGMLPITGITLPLISYGGSSLIITLISLGVLLNISQYQEKWVK